MHKNVCQTCRGSTPHKGTQKKWVYTHTHLDEVLLLRPVRLGLDLALGLKLLYGIPMLPPHLGSHAPQVRVAATRPEASHTEGLGDHHPLLLVEGRGAAFEHLLHSATREREREGMREGRFVGGWVSDIVLSSPPLSSRSHMCSTLTPTARAPHQLPYILASSCCPIPSHLSPPLSPTSPLPTSGSSARLFFLDTPVFGNPQVCVCARAVRTNTGNTETYTSGCGRVREKGEP